MSRARARSRRARVAVVACVLWLGGVEVMPALHEELHGRLAPHRHDGGSLVTVSFEDTTHRHPDGSIHWASATPVRSRATGKSGAGASAAGASPASRGRMAARAEKSAVGVEAERAGFARGTEDEAVRRISGSAHAGGLSHHAAALAPPPPPATAPLPIDRRSRLVVVAIAVDLVACDPLIASARGPPIAA